MLLAWIIVQIILETIPVSSSGHVTLLSGIMQKLGYSTDIIHDESINYLLHIPTLIVIVFYFFNRWWQTVFHKKLKCSDLFVPATYAAALRPIIFLGITTIITAAYKFSHIPSYIARCPYSLTFGLCCTALLLYVSRYAHGSKKPTWTCREAMVLGLVQALALSPGVSRFASTFVASRFLLGYASVSAFEISFMIQLPLLCAVLVQLIVLSAVQSLNIVQFLDFMILFGIVLSSVLSYYILKCMDTLIQRNRLWYLSWYMLLPIALSIIF
ncbi:undecaprenyl-diphosphate phosphatase [Candidatus Babeliales bacterium]|nr:undecaprenyl-diphosphate phosphatase [Candidatus Babeliales bacterium]